MGHIDSIIDSIKELNNLTSTEKSKGEILIGKVRAISDDGLTCIVQPLDVNRSMISNIFLTSDLNLPLLTPTIGSQVVITLFNETSGCIIQQGGVSKAEIAGNDYGGVVIASKLVQKLNNVENLLNSFFSLYNAHTHPYLNATTPAVTSPTTSLETQTLTPTIVKDVENEIVQHGKGTTEDTTYTQKVVKAAEELRIAENNLYTEQNSSKPQQSKIDSLLNIVNQKQEVYNNLVANPTE